MSIIWRLSAHKTHLVTAPKTAVCHLGKLPCFKQAIAPQNGVNAEGKSRHSPPYFHSVCPLPWGLRLLTRSDPSTQ